MPASRQGTGFTNLQTYLGLNQGAARRMGDTLAGDVERQGAQVSGDIAAEAAKTREGIKAGTLAMPGQDGVTSQQAQANAERIYNGPMGMDPTALTRLYGQAAAAQNQATALNSNTGRATLIGQKFGPNTWGGGQLDAALAGAGPAGGRLSAASGAYGRLLNTLGGTQSALQQEGRAAADATGKAAEAYGGMVEELRRRERQAANTHAPQPLAPRPTRPIKPDKYNRNPDNTPYSP